MVEAFEFVVLPWVEDFRHAGAVITLTRAVAVHVISCVAVTVDTVIGPKVAVLFVDKFGKARHQCPSKDSEDDLPAAVFINRDY